MSIIQFANENNDFPKHFVISRAVAESCLDYLQGQMGELKLDNRDWVPLAISIAVEANYLGQLEIYKNRKDELEKNVSLESRNLESKNRDIVTMSAMQEDSLSYILEMAVSELGAEGLLNNPRQYIDLLENWCELGLIILKDIWQTPDYNSIDGFTKALSMVAEGHMADLMTKMNL